MGAIILNYVVFGVIATAIGVLLLDFLRPTWRPKFFASAVFVTLTPYLLHASWTVRQIANWGPPAQQPPGYYGGLYLFLVSTVLVSVALSLLALWLTCSVPELAAAFPIVMGGLYWKVLLSPVYRSAPYGAPGDNAPLIALFLYTWIAACVVLLLAGRLRVLAGGSIRR